MAKKPIKFSGLLSSGVIPPSPSVESKARAVQAPHATDSHATEMATSELRMAPPDSAFGETMDDSRANDGLSGESGSTVVSDILIDVSKIDPNPFAPREIYLPEVLSERAADLATNGQIDSIHVIPHPVDNGRYMIADGWTRVLACQRYESLKQLRAKVHYELSPKEASWLGFRANHSRTQSCDFDDAHYFAKLIADGDSQRTIAERFNISQTRISMLQSFFRLPDEILALVKEYPYKFSYRVANDLFNAYRAVGIKKTLDIALKFGEENQTYRWLAGQVQGLLSPSQKTNKRSSVKVIRAENGTFRQNQGRFELTLQVPLDKEAEFASQLEALIAIYMINGQPPDHAAKPDAPEGTDQFAGQLLTDDNSAESST